MAHERSLNVQDAFLNYVRKNKSLLTIFLINGVKLTGIVTWFDNFSILLKRDGHSQLIYKHAISTLMPQNAIILFESNSQNVGLQEEDEASLPPAEDDEA